jgi:hypothetical protein
MSGFRVALLAGAVLVLWVFWSGVALADEKNIALKIRQTELEIKQVDKYQIVVLNREDSTAYLRKFGTPSLPALLLDVLAPPDAKFESVSVESVESTEIAGSFTIYPTQKPHPISGPKEPFILPDEKVYVSNERFPGKVVEYLRTGVVRGYKLLRFIVNPIQYIPGKKRLILNSKIKLRISYAGDPIVQPVEYNLASPFFERVVGKLVVNPGDISLFYESALVESTFAKGDGEVKYLIITSESMKAAFQTLADWKTEKGILAEILTIEEIGSDEESIKSTIQSYCTDKGTKWVVLGGDTDTVPAHVYTDPLDSVDGIPSDIYFTLFDGEGDMEPDTVLARISVETPEEAETVVAKILNYEKNPPLAEFVNKIFVLSNIPGGPPEPTRDVRDEYIKPYLPDAVIDSYVRGTGFSADKMFSKIESGYNMMFLDMHSGYNQWDFYDSTWDILWRNDAKECTNAPKTGSVFTTSCLSNRFTKHTISEAFLRNPDGGYVVYIGNAGLGFGIYEQDYPELIPYSSYAQAMRFYRTLYGLTPLNPRCGNAFTITKIERAHQMDGYSQHLRYGLNMLGCPEMPVWTKDPQQLTATHPEKVATGEQDFTVETLPGATVCLTKRDSAGELEVYGVGVADANGLLVAHISPASEGDLKVTVTEFDYVPYQATIPVFEPTTPLHITTTLLPDASLGNRYEQELKCAGGGPPYTWSVESGSLPGGLSMDPETGYISGIPDAVGPYTFAVHVEDSVSTVVGKELTIEVTSDSPVEDGVSTIVGSCARCAISPGPSDPASVAGMLFLVGVIVLIRRKKKKTPERIFPNDSRSTQKIFAGRGDFRGQ